MNCLILDADQSARAFGRLRDHTVQRVDTPDTDEPTEVPGKIFDCIVITGSESRRVQSARTAGMARRFADWLRSTVLEHGSVVVHLASGVRHENRANRSNFWSILDDSEISAVNEPAALPEIPRSSRVSHALERYGRKHARCWMRSPGLDRFVPIGGRSRAPAMRTAIRGSEGVELILQQNGQLTMENAADLLTIAEHYWRRGAKADSAEWKERLILWRDGVELGQISADEHRQLIADPGECFRYLLDLASMKFWSCLPNDRPAAVRLGWAELMSVLDGFRGRGRQFWPSGTQTPFFDEGGSPFTFASEKAKKKNIDKARRAINRFGDIIVSEPRSRSRSFMVANSVQRLGIIAPEFVLRQSKELGEYSLAHTV